MAANITGLTVLVIGLLACDVTGASRILLLSTPHRSMMIYFMAAGEALQEAGHDVYMLVEPTHEKAVVKRKFSYFTQAGKVDWETFSIESALFENKAGYSFILLRNLLKDLTNWCTGWCSSVLENRSLMNELENVKFDLVIVDGIDFFRCVYMIPYRLKVPYVTLTQRHDPWSMGIPTSPAGESLMGFTNSLVNPTFLQRLGNVCAYVAGMTLNPRYTVPDDLIARYIPDGDVTTFDELYRRSELFLVNRDVLCLDYPRMHTPHCQFIGGFGVGLVQPLPKDLESFVQGSGEAGIIVLTFGSAIKNLTPVIIGKLFTGLTSIKQRVVMRLSGAFDDVPPNVWLAEWLPQNDLLGHSKTRLFITHGGANGQIEALSHGVPMLTMPFFGDQIYNARASEDKGYGLTLDAYNFTGEQLSDAIANMLDHHARYRENIARCSAIVRSFPTAKDSLVFWVEHIIRFGGSHLRPSFVDLPMWKLFMLDIVAFCLVLLASVALVCRWCCRCVKRRCCRKSTKKKSD